MSINALKSTIGTRVREFRSARAMTQEDLADAIGRSVQAVSKFERGLTLPSLETLAVLASTLGVEVADLLRGDTPTSERVAFLRARIRVLAESFDESRLEATLKVMDVLGEQSAKS